MLCPSCHKPNRDNAKFCKSCGLSFTATSEGTGQPAEASPASPVEIASAPLPIQETPQPVDDAGQTVDDLPVMLETSEDLSLAPTLILTPQKMMAYHAHRWQQELEQELQDSSTDIADMPTILDLSGPPPTTPPTANTSASGPTSDSFATEATILPPAPPTQEPESHQADPASPEGESVMAPAPTATEETSKSPGTSSKENVMEQTTQPTTEQAGQEQVVPAANFPALAVGTVISERYEVTQVDNVGESEHTYQVVDHQGYQHCWNCGSEQNAEGDEFCIDCGAELLNATYTMHEYPASEHKDQDARVLQGVIVNTFVDQGHTYVIEQPQATQIVFPNGVHLLASCESDAGVVRMGEPNEDSALVLLFERVHESIAAPAGVFIVADGMGGHDNGQGASRMTIGIIAERIVRELLMPPLTSEKAGEAPKQIDEDTYVALVRGAVEDANAALCQTNQRDKSDMGSTLTGFMMVGDHAYIFNVGDSRTYLLRDGNLHQLTTDHSLVGQLVAGGLIEPDDVYTHPQRSQIYRSIGDKLHVQIDVFKQQVYPGDTLLSCSDGLWEMVRNPQISDLLANAPDPQAACARLVEAANTNGGEDNISAVVVFVR